MIKKLFLLPLILLVFSGNIYSQLVIGKYAGEFMAIGVGGRPLGMGGAYVALANDATAGYYNPAGLIRLNYPQISLMHDERYGNLVNYDFASVAIPYKADMSFGISVMRLGVDGIPDTRKALYDANGDGILDINTDKLDVSQISEFSDQDWAFYFTFAKKYNSNISFGANVKVISRKIAEYSAMGVGFDIGAIYTPYENLMLGVNVQDITTTIVAWSTGRNELITPTLKVGSAYALDIWGGKIIPALDFDIRFENRQYASQFNIGPVSFDPHVGLEYNFRNLFSVRAGYNDVKQFTIGAGVKLPKLNIDYSFARFNMSETDRLPDTHRISLILSIEEPKFLRKTE